QSAPKRCQSARNFQFRQFFESRLRHETRLRRCRQHRGKRGGPPVAADEPAKRPFFRGFQAGVFALSQLSLPDVGSCRCSWRSGKQSVRFGTSMQSVPLCNLLCKRSVPLCLLPEKQTGTVRLLQSFIAYLFYKCFIFYMAFFNPEAPLVIYRGKLPHWRQE